MEVSTIALSDLPRPSKSAPRPSNTAPSEISSASASVSEIKNRSKSVRISQIEDPRQRSNSTALDREIYDELLKADVDQSGSVSARELTGVVRKLVEAQHRASFVGRLAAGYAEPIRRAARPDPAGPPLASAPCSARTGSSLRCSSQSPAPSAPRSPPASPSGSRASTTRLSRRSRACPSRRRGSRSRPSSSTCPRSRSSSSPRSIRSVSLSVES